MRSSCRGESLLPFRTWWDMKGDPRELEVWRLAVNNFRMSAVKCSYLRHPTNYPSASSCHHGLETFRPFLVSIATVPLVTVVDVRGSTPLSAISTVQSAVVHPVTRSLLDSTAWSTMKRPEGRVEISVVFAACRAPGNLSEHAFCSFTSRLQR